MDNKVFKDRTQDWIHDSMYGHLHLRDFFAAFALTGLLAANPEYHYDGAAIDAYNHADAMLLRREAGIPAKP